MKSANDKRGFFIFIFIFAAGIIVYFSGVWKSPAQESAPKIPVVRKLPVIHTVPLNDPELFNNAFAGDKAFTVKPTGKVLAGILPHHYTLAAQVIAGFYEGLLSQQPDTIIVMGPDHFNQASRPIVTSLGSFSTLFGTISPQTDLINKILEDSGVIVDELPFETEHSIYSQLPFIKKTFPEAKIVPLIINISASKEDADKLAASISKKHHRKYNGSC
jgi:AmmeMemoRadiSam system protein B